MKTVENSYALASSVRDLNCRGIHLRWSFSLSLFDQRGSSAESVPSLDLATAPAIGPAFGRWPAAVSPALPQASATRAARRLESTPATSPPNAAHTHSRWLARSA